MSKEITKIEEKDLCAEETVQQTEETKVGIIKKYGKPVLKALGAVALVLGAYGLGVKVGGNKSDVDDFEYEEFEDDFSNVEDDE